MSDPIVRRKSELHGLDWPEFFKALPGFLAWKKSIKVVPGLAGYFCSYYTSLDDWDFWWSDRNPLK